MALAQASRASWRNSVEAANRGKLVRTVVRLIGAAGVAALLSGSAATAAPIDAKTVDPILLTAGAPPPAAPDGRGERDRERPVAMGISVPLPPPS